MIKVDYTYMDECVQKWATWRGDKKDAIRAAEEHLGAEPQDDGSWIYEAEETSEQYRLTEDEMLMAGAAILDGRLDWYSIWCASTGEEVEQ